MTDKPTITDEDRAAVNRVLGARLPRPEFELLMDFVHRKERAAFNAGLERAVKAVQVELAMCALVNDEAPSEWIDGFEFAWKRANAAIRAEKEKPQ